MKKKTLKIMLGDLRHSTVGKHSATMPLGIGCIASYALSHVDDVEIRLYDEPELFLKDFDIWNPDVIGLSNYCWNAELTHTVFQYAKQKNPGVVCVAGGPEFPLDHDKQKEYLLERREIDFYVYGEGEKAFSQLVQQLQTNNFLNLQTEPQDGVMSIHPETKELIVGEPIPRIMDLDVIPSPYLNGLMDAWFNGQYNPSVETIRGCPFTCGFCRASNQLYTPLAKYSVGRMKKELTYVAEKSKEYPNTYLLICDNNFGMFPYDEKIAKHIRTLQDTFNWPCFFNVSTGKAHYDRILNISSILQNKLPVSVSVQTLNPKTLGVIKRKNPGITEFKKINDEIKKRGMSSIVELILPLPEETRESFFGSIKTLFEIGVEFVVPYTTILLKGTPLASDESRKKYKMKTMFRIIPRQFGEYKDHKCFETEEVCIATDTLSFDDYVDCRGFSFVVSVLSSKQFDVIIRCLQEHHINFYDYLILLWNELKTKDNKLSHIYREYIEETKNELFESKEDIYKYFLKNENYQKLLLGELGDNLIRKYKTRLFLEASVQSIELSFFVLRKMIQGYSSDEVLFSLNALETWLLSTRNIGRLVLDKTYRETNEVLQLSYDVQEWYVKKSLPLLSYKKPVDYMISCDAKNINDMLVDLEKLYGKDLFFCIGKILIFKSVDIFWRESHVLKKERVCVDV